MVLMHFLYYLWMIIITSNLKVCVVYKLIIVWEHNCHLLSTFNKSIVCLHCILTCCQRAAVVVCKRRRLTRPSCFSIRFSSQNNDLVLSLLFAPKIYCLLSQEMAPLYTVAFVLHDSLEQWQLWKNFKFSNYVG